MFIVTTIVDAIQIAVLLQTCDAALASCRPCYASVGYAIVETMKKDENGDNSEAL